MRSFPRHPGEASWGLCAWLFWSNFLSHTPPCGIRPIKTLQSAAFTLRGSEGLEGPLPRHTMAARTVPHAYPMSSEYEFANPSKIYDQNFGEGKKGDGISPAPFSPLVQEGWWSPPGETELQSRPGKLEPRNFEHKNPGGIAREQPGSLCSGPLPPSMPTAVSPVPPSCPQWPGIHAYAVQTWRKMCWGGRGGGEDFAAGGSVEKLSRGVQHKAGQWLAEGKECGQQQNHSAPAQQREKAKSSKESPLDNGTQKAFSSSWQFVHHQHFPCPFLAVGFALQSTQCTYQSLPVHSADMQKLDASPWLAGSCQLCGGRQWLAGIWVCVCFGDTKVGTTRDSVHIVLMWWQNQSVCQVPASCHPPLSAANHPSLTLVPGNSKLLTESHFQVCPHVRF